MKSLEKVRRPHRRETAGGDDDFARPTVPVVDYEPMPRIRIYDGTQPDLYWFTAAGFTSKITDN